MPEDWHIYLDANFFIEAVEGENDVSEACWRLMRAGEARSGLLVTSMLTLSEALVLPLRQIGVPETAPVTQPIEGSTLASEYGDIITDSPRLSVAAVDRQIMIGAAHIRSRWTAGKLPDAIHLATAQMEGCTHLVNEDRKLGQFARRNHDLDVVTLSNLEASLTQWGIGT